MLFKTDTCWRQLANRWKDITDISTDDEGGDGDAAEAEEEDGR